MKYVRQEMGAYNLHLVQTKKFKTITVRVSFHRVIEKEDITSQNILCNMLTQSSKEYPSKKSLAIKTQDLYAATIRTHNSRLGNYMNTDIYLTILNDRYTEEGNYQKGIEFLKEIIFNPDIEKGKFRKENLDIVKTSARLQLSALKEDAASYALIRMFEALDKSSPSSYRMVGYLEDLDKITEESLFKYYQKMISSSLIDIFVIGDIDIQETTNLIKENFRFKTFKNQKVPYLLPEVKPRSRRLLAREVVVNNQSKLAIANRITNLSTYERNYPLTLYNIILGGSADSKLFQVVREKNSLCYTINSVPNKLDNLIIIRAGIDKSNYRKTVDLIEGQMQLMRKGKFSEEEINIAKEYYKTALEEVEDSPTHILDNYFMMELLNTDDIETKKKKIEQVTKEDIISVAKKIKMDTIFLLEGEQDEGN